MHLRIRKDTKPHLARLSLRPDGVFRCCAETLNAVPTTENEGDILPCHYCKHRLIVKDHIWQWDSDYESKEKS